MAQGDAPARDESMYEAARRNEFTDVQFRVGGQIFGAHRVVVCSGSEVFKNMLTSEFMEGHAQEPHPIEEVSIDAFEVVLRFLYMGAGAFKTPLTTDICDVLHAADRFCLPKMVEACIEAVQDGQITTSNCPALLNTACTLGGHGRDPLWSPLFKACAEYAAEHLEEMLDKWEGRPPKLALAGMCRLVELASPKVVSEPLLLRRLWKFVRAWGSDALGARNLKSFFQKLMQWTFEDVDFLDGTDFAFEVTGLDSADAGWRSPKGGPFRAGGFSFYVRLRREDVDGEAWYGIYLYEESTRGEWSSWCCHTLSQFRWVRSPGSPKARNMRHFFAAVSHSGSGFREFLAAAEAHSPAAGYIQDGRATVRVTVKVNPLVGLCTAAAFLEDLASPASVLRAITDVNMLGDMLAADNLPIESEAALLDVLADFADSEAAEKHARKLAALVPALRLDDVDFDKLISVARESPGLRKCKEFAERLQAHLERALTRPVVPWGQPRPAREPPRGAVWRSLQGPAPAAAGTPPPQPQPQPPDVRAVVRCLLSPPAGLEDLTQQLHASLEVQEQVKRQLRESLEENGQLRESLEAKELLAAGSRQAESARAAVRAVVRQRLPPMASAVRLQVLVDGIASVVHECLSQEHLEALACPAGAPAVLHVLAAAYAGALAGAALQECEMEQASLPQLGAGPAPAAAPRGPADMGMMCRPPRNKGGKSKARRAR